MPGLLRGMARVAIVSGTATAVSNRVSRRQAGRWAQEDQSQYYQEVGQQAVHAPPPAYEAPPAYAAPPAASTDSKLDQLKELGELRTAGILTEAEFAAQKAQILAS